MFDLGESHTTAVQIRAVATGLADLGPGLDDVQQIDAIRALEELKAACAAAQARVTADFDHTRRTERAERGVPHRLQGQGIAAEVALARRESPHRGGRHLGFATALVHEMPHTLRRLQHGHLNEWRATLLVRETACLTRDDRATLDRLLCSDPSTLDGLGDRALVAKATQLAARLDAEALVRRARSAEQDRRVSIRPAPDTMTYLTALLPVAHGVTVAATLRRDADRLLATGDAAGRSHSQLMADLLVERVTGTSTASKPPTTVNLVVSDRTLLAGGTDPARVDGYGDIPAPIVRTWIADPDIALALRMVYAHPDTGTLTAMESTARCFPRALARLIDTRDAGTCRTPWCDAPIRHHDHIRPHHTGGPTTAHNGAGLCQACNHAKQAEEWKAAPLPRSHRHSYEFSTPTGHCYRSTAPPLPQPAATRAGRISYAADARAV